LGPQWSGPKWRFLEKSFAIVGCYIYMVVEGRYDEEYKTKKLEKTRKMKKKKTVRSRRLAVLGSTPK